MKKVATKKAKQIVEYVLSDYQFLEDYQVIDSYKTNKQSFVACIRNSEQKVRFIKRKYSEEHFQRFKALHKLYKNGIVLSDNLFILQQCEQLYYYVIQAEIEAGNPRFQTLQHYLYHKEVIQQERKTILSKIKILIDCVHQEGQCYAGLDTRKIIIDDQKHLYLAPFDLQFQLKTDNFSRAYYPPELLLKINKSQSQISEQLLQKWDMWAFGCISLQILSYSSPYFMSTSLPKQLKMIKHFNVVGEVSNFEQSIRNIITNSLCLDWKHRDISIRSNEAKNIDQSKQVKQMLKQTIEGITSIKKQEVTNGLILRQLNIHNNIMNSGNCQLTLNLFTLSNITFQKELHISVYLNRVFHFYLDFDQKLPKKYHINRKLTVNAQYSDVCKTLMQPIRIELRQAEKVNRIDVNLQALVIVQDGKRIWNQPIIGTYTASNSSSFPKARLKMSCLLVTPQLTVIDFSETPQAPMKRLKSTTKLTFHQPDFQKISVDKNQAFKQNKTNFQTSPPKRKIEGEENGSIQLRDSIKNKGGKCQPLTTKQKKLPSIAEISQQITLITEQFKRKMVCEDTSKHDDIQQQLSTLLQLQ